MKRILPYIVLLGLLILPTSFADQVPLNINPPVFKHGEYLKYYLHYGFISGGMASLTVKQEVYDSKDAFHIVALGKTTGLVDKIYRVKDIYESIIDPKSGMPYKAVRNISEGNYKLQEDAFFNRTDNTVNSTRKGIVKVPVNCLDMVSAFYYIRRINFSTYKPGDIVYVDTYFDGLFPFSIVYKGKETIDTEFGDVRCLKFVPIVEPGRVFKENDDMTIWLSDDENKIPICIKFDLIVGSFKCDIEEYKNLKYDFKALVKPD